MVTPRLHKSNRRTGPGSWRRTSWGLQLPKGLLLATCERSCKVSAPCDLRGLVGLGGTVGLAEVKGEITIDTPATEEQVAQLKGAVDANCPMVDTIANPVKVETFAVRA